MPDTVAKRATGSLRQRVVDAAEQAAKDAAGKPYTTNGRTLHGFDCSGFVTYVYQKVLPHYQHLNTDGILCSRLYRKIVSPQPGDLIFFPAGVNPFDQKTHQNHVGIVLDPTTWIGSQSSTGVATVKMINPWWSARSKFFLQYGMLP